MKIALVHDFLLREGGAERVLEVFMQMFPEAPVFTLLYDEKRMGKRFPKERIRPSHLQSYPRFLPGMHKLLFSRMPDAIERFDFNGFDLVLSSSNAFAHGVLTPLKTTHISYYHSPMRYAWDYTHEYLNDQGLGLIAEWVATRQLHRVRQWDFLASDRVDIPIANSNTVRQRIQKYYRKAAQIIYPPVDVQKFHPQKEHQDYFLMVSTLSPYKRIDLAIELFKKVNKPLLIIGEGGDRKRLESMASSKIKFLGFQSDEKVVEYMQNARAFIFPGEEDFGIAPVEAMAAGKPILALRKGGLTETVLEGVTGEFFEEGSLESIEEALTQLLIHEKNYDSEIISKHAKQFSRARFEKEMTELISRAMLRS